MPLLAVVACVAILALVAAKGRVPWHRAARRIDERVAENNARAVRDSVGAQLTRLEHAIDAIAIEVERIAENQRFLTKLLANDPSRTRDLRRTAASCDQQANTVNGERTRESSLKSAPARSPSWHARERYRGQSASRGRWPSLTRVFGDVTPLRRLRAPYFERCSRC